MRRTAFTTLLLAACSGDFNPDLSDLSDVTDATETYSSGSSPGSVGDASDGSAATTSHEGTSGPDSSPGTGDPGSDATASDDTTDPDTGLPPGCGDGEAQGAEECDGLDLRGKDCTGRAAPANGNFHGGALACNADCTYDTSACVYCGDGVKNGSEACDGDDLGGASCQSEGFDGGDLFCGPHCSLQQDCANCEGDPAGIYGLPSASDCGGGGSISGQWNGAWWRVCLAPCVEDDDCFEPILQVCEVLPVCGIGDVCRLPCEADADCPSGMFCMLDEGQTLYGTCAWWT